MTKAQRKLLAEAAARDAPLCRAIAAALAEIARLRERMEFYRTAAMVANRDLAEVEGDGQWD